MTTWNVGPRTRQLARHDQRGLQAWARMEALRKKRRYVLPYGPHLPAWAKCSETLIKYILWLEMCPFCWS